MVPVIKSYHPCFVVRNGSVEHVIEAEVRDWASDADVLRGLAGEYGVGTAGELVAAIEAKVGPAKVVESGVRSPQISVGGRPCLEWDDRLA